MHPRKLVRDSVGFVTAQYLVRAAMVARGIVGARLLGPGPYGAWNALMLLLDYGTFAPFGTQQGLDQAVPGRIVAGERGALERLERAGLFNVVLFTLAFALLAVLNLTWGGSGRIVGFWGLGGVLLALVCVLLVNVSNYHLTLLRSHGRIHAVSTWFVIQGAIGTVLGLSLIPFIGAWGLLWGWVAGTAAGMLYARAQGSGVVPAVPRPARESLQLVRVGLPMFFYNASSFVMRNVDRMLILRFLGTERLGYYTLGIMVLSFLLYLPDSLSYVLYPDLLRRYHAAGDDREAIRGLVMRAMRVLSVAVPAVCGLAFLGVREATLWLLPDFLPGSGAARILCFGAGVIALSNLSAVVLMTLGRHHHLGVATAVVTVLGIGAEYAAVRLGYGLNGVAWAALATFTASGVLLTWLAFGGLGLEPLRRARLLLVLLLPVAAGLALSVAMDRVMPFAGSFDLRLRAVRVLLAMAGFGVAYAALAVPLLRQLGLRQLLQEFKFPRLGRRVEVPGA